MRLHCLNNKKIMFERNGNDKMKLSWMMNGFICRDLYAPFIIDRDNDYISDLKRKYKIVLNQAVKAGADEESLKTIRKFSKKIIEALNCYYTADIAKSNTIIKNLLIDIGEDPFAVNTLNSSCAFPGDHNQELQFFRSRTGNPSKAFTAKEMSILPLSLRSKSGNYRFSIPGNPSLYLANSSYGCWIETGFPSEIDFNVSPVVLDGTQKIFNLAVTIRDFHHLNEFESDRVHCWLKLYMLAIATSYRIKEDNRTFKSEYIISQAIMMACKKLGYDGIAYYSKRVDDESFALCAINLALFADYRKNSDSLEKHMKIDDSFNFFLFTQLGASLKYMEYPLRSIATGFITNIGGYDRQYPYREISFYEFDKFLFSTWERKPGDKAKDKVDWGAFAK